MRLAHFGQGQIPYVFFEMASCHTLLWMSPGRSAEARRMTTGQAIKLAMGPMRQVDLAEALGTDQGTVSTWCTDKVVPSLTQIENIEDATGQPRGFILRAAGYVVDVTDVPSAIEHDPMLSTDSRRLLLAMYREAIAPPLLVAASRTDNRPDQGDDVDESVLDDPPPATSRSRKRR